MNENLYTISRILFSFNDCMSSRIKSSLYRSWCRKSLIGATHPTSRQEQPHELNAIRYADAYKTPESLTLFSLRS